jgi:hypothetical protein
MREKVEKAGFFRGVQAVFFKNPESPIDM